MKIAKVKKWEDLLGFSAVILLIILINIHAGNWFFRLDLTEEKRYTISDASKQCLTNLDDVVYIEVFLDGELNASFKRLQKSIRETLEEFRLYGGDRIQFKFTNPDDAASPAERNQIHKQLMERGLPATTLNETVNGEKKQKLIFPGAMISYRNRELPVLLLKGNKLSTPQQQINQSVEGVEFELANAIRQLSIKNKKKIAFTQGHDELSKKDLIDITTTLEETYLVDHIYLDEVNLTEYDALLIAHPKKAFSETEKFLLDQFIMQGGNALFLIDPIQMNLDSIPIGGTYAFGYDLQLEDLLFRYGIRLNNNLVQDQQAGLIEVYTGNFGDRPQVQRLPWPYYVFLNKFSEHPIVRNMDVIYGKFISTLDTVKAAGIRKTPLVFTSKYTKTKTAPTKVDINELKGEMRIRESYNQSHLPVSYLLEGKFTSLYANQAPPAALKGRTVISSGQSKVLVFADADFIRNEFDRKTNKPLPIDLDKSTQQTLSNKEFILNTLAYMTEKDGIINARNKQITLRLMDTIKAKEEKSFWQVMNLVLPILIVIAFAFLYNFMRKQKYTKY
ncbi:MAG: gliding motility-associated ABC transporter substrate-binding protein GldG [Flammeovirgaceae bacterium]